MKENQRPLILVSNDDGIMAKGINELIKFLRPLGEVVAMVPDRPRSGTACSLTVTEPIHYELMRKEVGLTVYRCSGTPTDCIKLALHTVLDRRPDLVVAGINHGDNSSVNVHYSGTMGVVMEGCLKGIPSIGFSICDHSADADFAPTGPYIRSIVQQVLQQGLPLLSCLNVNFPAIPDYKGVRVCRQTAGQWEHEWEHFAHRGDTHYYWLTGEFVDADADCEETDHWALNNGYVAITPVRADVTDYALKESLKQWFE